MAFAAQTALVTLALAMALLCVASGNLHGYSRVRSDLAHLAELFSAATTSACFLALCALAQADAALASSGGPVEERACRRPLTTSCVIARHSSPCFCVRYPPTAPLHVWLLSWPWYCATPISRLCRLRSLSLWPRPSSPR